ncbi:MAG: hypothetical protein A3G87_07495 [Omnitrophica bacterium RIFCSPLOWO2_12_FULL_50_11]|nr:MAG: hypothetical protein A3G87_07495 [Omnitrophica bacterium RIFCSPLOWO2_12_FULL_50_11]
MIDVVKKDYQRVDYLKRLHQHLITPVHPPIQVILGPRQVGKTTAIKSFMSQWKGPSFYHTADQISPPDAQWMEQQWMAARKGLTHGQFGLLVFDEIQKIPRWSEVAKKCYDEDHGEQSALRVVVLGSSSLMVQRGLTESLAGRFEIIRFPHWSYRECCECFGISLDQYIFYGGYPGALRILIDSQWDLERWRAYVQNSLIETVLSKDILMLTPVTKPALFRQAFSLSCMHPAEIFSLNKMLGQLHEAGNASTLAFYLRLLDAAMLLKPLERYSGNRVRVKISSPKLIVLNNALINAISVRGFSEAKQDQTFWGRLVENAVGASLTNNDEGIGTGVFYWRERDQEIDFVLKRGQEVVGIEVKTTLNKRKESQKHPFLRRFPKAKILTTGITGGDIPLGEILSMSHDDIFSQLKRKY